MAKRCLNSTYTTYLHKHTRWTKGRTKNKTEFQLSRFPSAKPHSSRSHGQIYTHRCGNGYARLLYVCSDLNQTYRALFFGMLIIREMKCSRELLTLEVEGSCTKPIAVHIGQGLMASEQMEVKGKSLIWKLARRMNKELPLPRFFTSLRSIFIRWFSIQMLIWSVARASIISG